MKKLLLILVLFLPSVSLAADCTSLTDSLQGYWKLNESSGDAASEVNSNTLTNTNTVTYVAAKISNGADFEYDSTQRLQIADASQTGLDMTGDMSISFWTKAESAPANDSQVWIVRKDNGNGYSILYQTDAGGTKYVRTKVDVSSTGQTKSFLHTISTSAFEHIVFRFTSSTKEHSVWFNGVEETPQTGNVNPADSTDGFALGGSSDGNANTYDGVLDEVGVWSCALTDAQIGSLYNSGAGLTHPFTVASVAQPIMVLVRSFWIW